MIVGSPTKLNLVPSGVMPVVYINQDDAGYDKEFLVYNGDSPYNVPAGVSATIRGKKADGYGVTEAAALTEGSNLVTVTITEQMVAAAGENLYELVFVDTNDLRVASINMVWAVKKDALGDAVISESDLDYATQVMDQLQSVQAFKNQMDANTSGLAAETAARIAADDTLQTHINTEAQTRAAQDTNLQQQINQLVAPSGEAPSAAEVENARIGANGLTYSTLGDAIRGQITDLDNQIAPFYDLFTVPVTFNNLATASLWAVGQAIQASTGYTDTGKPAYIRTAWVSCNAPTLIWIDSQNYKFIVWGYSASSSTAGTYSPQKVYAQNPVVIAPIQGTVSFRLGVTRVDGATMTNTDVANVISALRTYKLPGIRSGMKIACFGDSIMWGRDGNGNSATQVTETIPKIMSKALGCQCDNYGVGNQGYLPHGSIVSAYDTISAVNLTGYDAMIMCFGVNDGYSDLGDWNSTDEGTIMGQFNKIINYVFTQNPKIRLIVIAPWNGRNIGTAPDYWYGPRNHASGYVSRRILSDTLKTACDYYWIPYIEQYDGPINPLNIVSALPDGVHPSADYYKLIGAWLAAKVATFI